MNNAGVKWIALFGRSKLDAGKPGGDDDVMKLAAELPAVSFLVCAQILCRRVGL